jgi:hypothetical protein
MKGQCVFFHLSFIHEHVIKIKNMGFLTSPNGSKLYAICDIYIAYTTILHHDHWIKIKMIVRCFIS